MTLDDYQYNSFTEKKLKVEFIAAIRSWIIGNINWWICSHHFQAWKDIWWSRLIMLIFQKIKCENAKSHKLEPRYDIYLLFGCTRFDKIKNIKRCSFRKMFEMWNIVFKVNIHFPDTIPNLTASFDHTPLFGMCMLQLSANN